MLLEHTSQFDAYKQEIAQLRSISQLYEQSKKELSSAQAELASIKQQDALMVDEFKQQLVSYEAQLTALRDAARAASSLPSPADLDLPSKEPEDSESPGMTNRPGSLASVCSSACSGLYLVDLYYVDP